MLHVTLLY